MKRTMQRFLFLMVFPLLLISFYSAPEEPIIDSKMTFDEAIAGTGAPQNVIDSLCMIDVQYYALDGKLHQGQLVVHVAIRDDVIEIFKLIKETKFPIQKAIPIVAYGWSDDESMRQNNTSAFNYRTIAGTDRMSNHAYGRAVDINPVFNPVIYPNGTVSPEGAHYKPSRRGTLHDNCPVAIEFKKRGWRWGGDFATFKDYHHFDKLK